MRNLLTGSWDERWIKFPAPIQTASYAAPGVIGTTFLLETARSTIPIGANGSYWDSHNGNLSPEYGLSTLTRTVAAASGIGTTGTFANQDVNGLLAGTAWVPTSLTFSFPTAKSNYGGASYSDQADLNGFQSLSLSLQAQVRSALGLISQYTGMTFNEITETDTTHATLRFAASSTVVTDNGQSTSRGWFPDALDKAGDVFYGNIRNDDPVKGSYAYFTVLHEIGHTLGLKHGNETWSFGALPANHDSSEWSIMDYHSFIGGEAAYTNDLVGSGSQSYMTDDISALQYLYGANFNTNSSDTRYTWSPTTGEMFVNGIGQGAASANKIYQAIWDGGGNDTYDLSNYTGNLILDLRPGEWSTFSAAQLALLNGPNSNQLPPGNIANANEYNKDPHSLIENAVGGNGNDKLYGNDANNELRGGAGNDTYFFNLNFGHDAVVDSDSVGSINIDGTTLGAAGGTPHAASYVGPYHWVLDGTDLTVFPSGPLFVHHNGNTITINNFQSGQLGIILQAAPSIVYGNQNNIQTGVSNTQIFGTSLNDTILSSGDGNSIYGGLGNDELITYSANNYLSGGDGDDFLAAGAGSVGVVSHNTLDGGNGNDMLLAPQNSMSADTVIMYGGDGDDTFGLGAGTALIYCGAGDDNVLFGIGSNIGNATIYGGDGNDLLSGLYGDDHIFGEAGDDRVFGGVGSDVLDGGAGYDVIAGGEGGDRFVVTPHAGAYTEILDFEVNNHNEQIDLSAFGYSHLSDLVVTSNGQGYAVINLANDQKIVLDGIAATSITAANFAGFAQDPVI